MFQEVSVCESKYCRLSSRLMFWRRAKNLPSTSKKFVGKNFDNFCSKWQGLAGLVTVMEFRIFQAWKVLDYSVGYDESDEKFWE